MTRSPTGYPLTSFAYGSHRKTLFRRRKLARCHSVFECLDRLEDHLVHPSESANESGMEFACEMQHIVGHQHLAIAMGTGPDAQRWDG